MNQDNQNNEEEIKAESYQYESKPLEGDNSVFEKKHEWRQQGDYIVCISCQQTHASRIPTDMHMVGIDEKGLPILEKVVIRQ